jgi:hypothetical protein
MKEEFADIPSCIGLFLLFKTIKKRVKVFLRLADTNFDIGDFTLLSPLIAPSRPGQGTEKRVWRESIVAGPGVFPGTGCVVFVFSPQSIPSLP